MERVPQRICLRFCADQDDPQRLHHPGLPGEMDPADQDGHPGPGGVVGSQPGEGGSSGPRGLLLRKPLLQPLLQVQQERGQAERGTLPYRKSCFLLYNPMCAYFT